MDPFVSLLPVSAPPPTRQFERPGLDRASVPDLLSGGRAGRPILQLFEERVERLETGLPVLTELLGPVCNLPQRVGMQPAQVLPSGDPAAHELGPLQHAHVLRGGGEGHLQRGGQFGEIPLALGQCPQHAPPGRMGQGMKDTIQHCVLMSNHVVYYIQDRDRLSTTWFIFSIPAAGGDLAPRATGPGVVRGRMRADRVGVRGATGGSMAEREARRGGSAPAAWLGGATSRQATMSILDAIGNTSLVPLRHIAPLGCARVLVKLEWENPTGSIKDRMALAVISRAVADGRLRPGETVVEYTGGSTGTSLALVCAAMGRPIRIVTSDAFSREKRDHMAALGATLTLVPSEGGLTTRQLILDMIETARRISAEPGVWWVDQLNNQDSIAGYHGLGEEIWQQTQGGVDAFVHCVGTAASSRGVATVLKRHKPGVRVVAVEPAESAVLAGGEPGPHKIEGVGIGFRPPLWEPSLVDEILPVSTADAKAMTRRLAREEGLFAGTSSGANVHAALRVASQLGPGATVVTLMADSGLKYLSTDVYRGESSGESRG